MAINSSSSGNGAVRQNSAFTVLLLYFFFEYVRPQSGGILPFLSPLKIPMFLTLFLLVIFLGSRKEMIRDRLVAYVLLFIFLIGFSVTYAPNTYHVWGVFRDMMVILFCIIMVMPEVCDSPERLDRFLNMWVFFNCLLALFAITHGGHGPSGFLRDENDLALALNMCIPISFYLSLRSKVKVNESRSGDDGSRTGGVARKGARDAGKGKGGKNRKILMLAATGLLLIGSGATMSRGGFLGTVSVIGMFWLLSANKFRNLVIFALCAAILSYPLYLALPDKYKSEMETISDPNDSTREDRIKFWGYGWKMFLDNPVLGVGAMNFPWTVPFYQMREPDYDPDRVTLYGGRPAHSLYFTLIPELGLAGITIYLLILKQLFGRLRRLIRLCERHDYLRNYALIAKALFVSAIAYLVTGAFISVLYYPPFWYLIAFVLTLDRVAMAEYRRLNGEQEEHASKGYSYHRNGGTRGRGKYTGAGR